MFFMFVPTLIINTMKKQKEKPFWETNTNPITGWKVFAKDELINSSKLAAERRILKSLKSYGNNG